jgi:hypothetical protein
MLLLAYWRKPKHAVVRHYHTLHNTKQFGDDVSARKNLRHQLMMTNDTVNLEWNPQNTKPSPPYYYCSHTVHNIMWNVDTPARYAQVLPSKGSSTY